MVCHFLDAADANFLPPPDVTESTPSKRCSWRFVVAHDSASYNRIGMTTALYIRIFVERLILAFQVFHSILNALEDFPILIFNSWSTELKGVTLVLR